MRELGRRKVLTRRASWSDEVAVTLDPSAMQVSVVLDPNFHTKHERLQTCHPKTSHFRVPWGVCAETEVSDAEPGCEFL